MTIVKEFLLRHKERIFSILLSISYIASLFFSAYSQMHSNQEYSLNIFTTPASFLFIVNIFLSLYFTFYLILNKTDSKIYYLQFIQIYNHLLSLIILKHPEIGSGIKFNIFFWLSIALNIILLFKIYPKLYGKIKIEIE